MPTYQTAPGTFTIQATQYDTGAALDVAGAVGGTYFGPDDNPAAPPDALPVFSLGAGARNAAAGDEVLMRVLLMTPVDGVSPLEELEADYGNAVAFSESDLEAKIADPENNMVTVVYIGERLVAWSLMVHHNGMAEIGISTEDAWENAYIVTEKSLSAADRLALVTALGAAAATRLADTTYVWGDVRTPGNLDTYLASLNYPSVPVESHGVSCNRYYARTMDGLN